MYDLLGKPNGGMKDSLVHSVVWYQMFQGIRIGVWIIVIEINISVEFGRSGMYFRRGSARAKMSCREDMAIWMKEFYETSIVYYGILASSSSGSFCFQSIPLDNARAASMTKSSW